MEWVSNNFSQLSSNTGNDPHETLTLADFVLLSLNQTLTVIKSHTAILPCEYLRNEREPNQFHRLWMKDESVLSGSSNRIWSVQDELRIRDTRQRDSGNYSCTVKNSFAEETVHYQVVIQGWYLKVLLKLKHDNYLTIFFCRCPWLARDSYNGFESWFHLLGASHFSRATFLAVDLMHGVLQANVRKPQSKGHSRSADS